MSSTRARPQPPSVQRQSSDGFRWQLAEDVPENLWEEVCERLDAYGENGRGTIVKTNRVRTVIRIAHGDGELYLKKFRIRKKREQLKHLLIPSKARAEWNTMRAFHRLGIPTARALAIGEAREGPLLVGAALVTEGIEGSMGFHDALEEVDGRPEEEREPLRRSFLEGMAEIAAAIHRAGYLHRDLHGGNFLFNPTTGKTHVLDLHKAIHPGWIPRFLRARELGFLVFGLRSHFSPDAIAHLVATYREGEVDAGFLASVRSWADRHESVRARSRDKRCMVESTVYTRGRHGSFWLWARRDVPPGLFESLLGNLGDGEVLKKEGARQTVRVSDGTLSWIVKSYPGGLGATLTGGQARRAWKLAHAFEQRGLPTPRAQLLAEERTGPWIRRSLLVFEDLADAVPLPRAIAETTGDARRHRLAEALGRLFAQIHEAGVYHNDTKGPNILVRWTAGEPELFWIDLDGAKVRGLNARRRLKNLAALERHLRSWGPDVPLSLKVRFLRAYDPEGDVRSWLERIDRAVRSRLERS